MFSLSQADKANWLANLQKHINKVALVGKGHIDSHTHTLSLSHYTGGNQTVVPRAVWVPDSHSKECMVCGQKFTAFNRKHHCRQCGRVVCSTCSPHRVIIDGQTTDGKPERVCSGCIKEVTTIKSKGSPELNAKQPPGACTYMYIMYECTQHNQFSYTHVCVYYTSWCNVCICTCTWGAYMGILALSKKFIVGTNAQFHIWFGTLEAIRTHTLFFSSY